MGIPSPRDGNIGDYMNSADKIIFISEVITTCKNPEQLNVCKHWIQFLIDKNILNKYDAKTLFEVARNFENDMGEEQDVPRSDLDQLTGEERRRELSNLTPGELYE